MTTTTTIATTKPRANDDEDDAAARQRRRRRRLMLLGAGAAATGVAAAALAARRARQAAPASSPQPRQEQQQWTARRAAGTGALALAGAYGLRGAWRVWRLLSDPGDPALLLEHDCVPPPPPEEEGAAAADDAASPSPLPFDHRLLVARDTAAALARCGASEDLADLAAGGALAAVDCAAYVRTLLREAEGVAAASDAPWWKGPYRTRAPATGVPGTVVLVGTAHVSPRSARDAARAVERLCPHVIFVELCRDRAGLMSREGAVPAGLLPPALLEPLGRGGEEAAAAAEEEEELDAAEAAAILREARAVARDLGLPADDDDDEDDEYDDDDEGGEWATATTSSSGESEEEKGGDGGAQQRAPPPNSKNNNGDGSKNNNPAASSTAATLRAALRGGSGLAALASMMEALYARFEDELGVKAGGEFVAARLAAEDLSREGALCSERPELWERLARVAAARRRRHGRRRQKQQQLQLPAAADDPSSSSPDSSSDAAAAAMRAEADGGDGGQTLSTRRALLSRLALCQPRVALGDRPVRDTLRAMWASLKTPSRRLVLAWHLVRAAASPGSLGLDAAAVEALKDEDALNALVQEFGREFPELLAPLIHDRNFELASGAWVAGAGARARVARAGLQAQHLARHDRACAEAAGARKAARGHNEDADEDEDERADDLGPPRDQRRRLSPPPPAPARPPFRPLAPWQLQKLLSELDGGTRRDDDRGGGGGEEEEEGEEEEGGGGGGRGGGSGGDGAPPPPSPPEVVAIVGKGHVGGMVYALRRMCEAFAERVIAQRCALEQERRAREQQEQQQQQEGEDEEEVRAVATRKVPRGHHGEQEEDEDEQADDRQGAPRDQWRRRSPPAVAAGGGGEEEEERANEQAHGGG